MTKNATTIWPHETPYALTHLDLHLLSLTPYEVDLWQTKNTIDISVFSYKSIYVLWWSKQAASKTRKNIFVIVPMSNDLSPCRTCAVTYFCHIHKGDYWVAVVIKRGKCTCPSTGMFKHFYDEYFWRVKKKQSRLNILRSAVKFSLLQVKIYLYAIPVCDTRLLKRWLVYLCDSDSV